MAIRPHVWSITCDFKTDQQVFTCRIIIFPEKEDEFLKNERKGPKQVIETKLKFVSGKSDHKPPNGNVCLDGMYPMI